MTTTPYLVEDLPLRFPKTFVGSPTRADNHLINMLRATSEINSSRRP
jgi:hypothetical protein